jgi:hypothetical protein
MSLKDLLDQWDAANPDRKITLNTETIHAALGDPRVMILLLQIGGNKMSDITKELTEQFGGDRDREVNFRDVAAKIDVMPIPPNLKQAIKDSLLDLG